MEQHVEDSLKPSRGCVRMAARTRDLYDRR